PGRAATRPPGPVAPCLFWRRRGPVSVALTRWPRGESRARVSVPMARPPPLPGQRAGAGAASVAEDARDHLVGVSAQGVADDEAAQRGGHLLLPARVIAPPRLEDAEHPRSGLRVLGVELQQPFGHQLIAPAGAMVESGRVRRERAEKGAEPVEIRHVEVI